jgi:cupredoxin-like protein
MRAGSIRNNGARSLAAVIALTVAGCGASTPVRALDRTVSIRITDFRLHPQVIRVPRGVITFKVANAGRLPHDFVINGRGGGQKLKLSTMLPGESDQGTVKLRPGNYKMFCMLSNHEELGEYGTLQVR